MNIFIDESGSFVTAPGPGGWNVVAALTVPEGSRANVVRAVADLKRVTDKYGAKEVKLNQLTEAQYISFLRSLSLKTVALFATATDAYFNTPGAVFRHRSLQARAVRRNVPRMIHLSGKQMVVALADQVEALPDQLYTQLVCQINLLYDVIARSITFFAQRQPSTLSRIRWRIDQKNTAPTAFEEAFERIAPPLLQSRSQRSPMVRVVGFDYSHFKEYEYGQGVPDYLVTEFGHPDGDVINVGKLVRGDLRFVDSKSSAGVQAADLLASGLRRCLRGGFVDNERVASLLGRLLVQNERGKESIDLISLGGHGGAVSGPAAPAVRVMSKHSQGMLL